MSSFLLLISLSILFFQTQCFLLLKKPPLLGSPVPPTNSTPLKIDSFAKNLTIPSITSPTYSGYLNVNKTLSNSSLYYIFYGCPKANLSTLSNFPIIIWLNGGPGSSSLLGAFYENGPFSLIFNETTKSYQEAKRNITWNENYSMLFVDQPIGTGGSYAQSAEELTVNQSQIAQHFYNALQEFYHLPNFTSLQKTPLFLFGESYAGKYVPCISHKILLENKKGSNLAIPLIGSGVGDGFTDPLTIMSEVGMFSYNLGLIDYRERMIIEQNILKGLMYANQGEWQKVTDTFNYDVFQNLLDFAGNVNVYNIQVYGDYNMSALDSFLTDNETRTRYNLLVDYSQGNDDVYNALGVDFMQPYLYIVEELLNMNFPMIFYNGQDDLIVTNPGTMTWVEKMNWSGGANFSQVNFELWNDKRGNVIGYKKRYGPLELRIVNKAGHLVPMDQPESAIDLAYDFIGRCLNSSRV